MRTHLPVIGITVIAVALYVVGILGLVTGPGASELLDPTTFPDRLVIFGGAGMFASMLTFIAAFVHMSQVTTNVK